MRTHFLHNYARSAYKAGLGFVLALGAASAAADCDCGSSDQNNACTGNSISVQVKGEALEKFRTATYTWEFNSGGAAAQCGQFANGDYWVAPAKGMTSVTVTSVSGSGSGQLFVDENPTVESMGFMSKNYGNLNTNENLLPRLPYTVSGNTSLVAASQRNESAHGGCGTAAIKGSCIDAYNVLTVLQSVPVGAGRDVLRPNISRAEKDLMVWTDFDFTRLPTKSFLKGTDTAGLEAIRSTWSHHIEVLALLDKNENAYSEGGRAFRADLVTDDYAATVAQQWHDHLMIMLSDDNTAAAKKAALAAMLTYGKDIYHAAYDGNGQQERWFGSGAGQWLGRFPAAVFFAAMAKDDAFGQHLSTASQTQTNGPRPGIHELDQVNIGHNGPVWGDKNDISTKEDLGRYWGEMLAFQKFDGASGKFPSQTIGKKTYRDPHGYIDGPGAFPGTLYASVSAGPIKAFAAEMLMIEKMCEITNYDPIVEYANRINNTGILVFNDPCAPPDPREDPSQCDTYHAQGCKYYGLSNTGVATWGPDPKNPTSCITNGVDPLTGAKQQGRFGSKHGQPFDVGYRVAQVENNWSLISQNRTSCRTTDRPKAPTGLREAGL